MTLRHEAVFVAGTDTGIGKTFVSLALMSELQEMGYLVNGMKPVASGCQKSPGGLRNEDAELLQTQSSSRLDYSLVNPFAYEAAVSPNIAAAAFQRPIVLNEIMGAYQQIKADVDLVVLEGIGGWKTPFSPMLSSIDIVLLLKIPVILVVGLRLGCINHALLTAESLLNSNINVIGWVANDIDGCEHRKIEMINTLDDLLSFPQIANFPLKTKNSPPASGFDFSTLVGS